MFTPEVFSNGMMELLEDKSKMVARILAIMDECNKIHNGLNKVVTEFDEHSNPNQREKQLKTCLKMQAKLAKNQGQLSMLLLIYASSTSFDSDVGKILVKLGRGEEALRTMLNNKFKNK